MHKLHDRQLELFKLFMSCFIRAEHLKDATPKEMANLVIEGKMLPFAQLYVGREADSFRTKSPRHPVSILSK